MNAPFAGLRILYVAPVDDAELAHNGLRRRALERLGANLLHIDPDRAGWLERLVRRDLEHRIATALDQHTPDLVIISGDGLLTAESVDTLRKGRRARWIQLLGDELNNAANASREAMDDLKSILAGRAAFYSKAEFSLDTSAQPLAETFAALRRLVREALEMPATQ